MKWLLLLTLTLCLDGWCDTAPQTRADVRIEPPGAIRAGQSAQLVVEIWVTTWFLQAPQLPQLNIAGASVTLPDAADHLREQKDGTEWFGIRRAYIVTATQAGELQVPALDISVNPGPDGNAQTLHTNALTIKVEGSAAPGNALITTRLDLKQAIQNSAAPLKVGDSITRTLTQTASGTQAMLLPPLHFAAIDGLALYPAPAQVENLSDGRGGLLGGRRIDAATYVAQRAGDYRLPAIQVHWWDPATQQLRTASAAAVSLKIAPNPQARAEFSTPAEHFFPSGANSYVLIFFTVLLISAALWYAMYLWNRCWPPWQARLRHWRIRYEHSESHAWSKLRALRKSKDPVLVYRALTQWSARLPGAFAGPAHFAANSGDGTLRQEVKRLEQSLYTNARDDWSAERLLRHCAVARRELLRDKRAVSPALKPLNPD